MKVEYLSFNVTGGKQVIVGPAIIEAMASDKLNGIRGWVLRFELVDSQIQARYGSFR
jgi:hypothetical protein